jgi:hypothetical protein
MVIYGRSKNMEKQKTLTLYEGFFKATVCGLVNQKYLFKIKIKYNTGWQKIPGMWKVKSVEDGKYIFMRSGE